MKKTFMEQLKEITEAAQQAITEIMAKQKSIVLFSATREGNAEWTLDIYDDVPDFLFVDNDGLTNYAAVKEIHLIGHRIEITGILKADVYPNEIKVQLNLLDAYSSAALADFIVPQSPDNPEGENH